MAAGQDPSKVDFQEIDNWLVSRNANRVCPVCEVDPKRCCVSLIFVCRRDCNCGALLGEGSC